MISKKHITSAQAVYINNVVLIPRLEYRLKTSIWDDHVYEELFRPVYMAIKKKHRLPINTHSNILTHKAIGNVKNLWRNQLASQITEFFVSLNSADKASEIVIIRLKK